MGVQTVTVAVKHRGDDDKDLAGQTMQLIVVLDGKSLKGYIALHDVDRNNASMALPDSGAVLTINAAKLLSIKASSVASRVYAGEFACLRERHFQPDQCAEHIGQHCHGRSGAGHDDHFRRHDNHDHQHRAWQLQRRHTSPNSRPKLPVGLHLPYGHRSDRSESFRLSQVM